MDLESSRLGPATVMRLGGRIDAQTAPALQQTGLEAVQAGETVVVLDFGGVSYISSAGVRSLLVIGKALQEGGGGLRLANVGGVAGQVLELAGIYSLFPHFNTAEEAAAA